MRWMTRERPKIDRVATAWLIARFIDRESEFLFAPAAEVMARSAALGATPYDVDGAPLSHRGPLCTFDAVLADHALDDPALADLAVIVRGADTDRLDLTPQSPGLLAISLGLSRLCLDDDQRMLAHGFVLYDALYEWLRYARAERHGWDPAKVGAPGEPAWNSLVSGPVELDLAARRAVVDGRAVELGPKEFALLVALVARAGRVLSRGFLLQHVWAYEADVASRTVDWHVAALRKRLGANGALIATVRGGGYRWDGGAPR
ncbi:MAG: chromate resistance protein [Gemmatimonadetes bacterium]|nr:chromate resistance protein [Gemmatimonadota bacterium]